MLVLLVVDVVVWTAMFRRLCIGLVKLVVLIVIFIDTVLELIH